MTLVLEKSKRGFTKPRRLLTAKESEASRVQTQTCGSSGIDYQWEADLADVQNLSQYNNGIKFLLVIVDVFSRFMWVRPLKDRKTKSVIEAFQDILSGPRRPKVIRTDKGSEFYNRYLQKYMREQDIKIIYALNEIKDNFPRVRTHWDFVNLILQM